MQCRCQSNACRQVKKNKFSGTSVSAADTFLAGVAWQRPDSVTFDNRTGFETVDGAAVGAAGGACVGQIEENPRRAAPGGHPRVGAVGRQIGCVKLDDRIATGGSRQIAGMARRIAHVEYR
jgi:hypothetical protein